MWRILIIKWSRSNELSAIWVAKKLLWIWNNGHVLLWLKLHWKAIRRNLPEWRPPLQDINSARLLEALIVRQLTQKQILYSKLKLSKISLAGRSQVTNKKNFPLTWRGLIKDRQSEEVRWTLEEVIFILIRLIFINKLLSMLSSFYGLCF